MEKMEKVYNDAVEALNKYSKNETKDTAVDNPEKVLEGMSEDKKNYLNFILRQIEFNTDFAKWFKASMTMNPKEWIVFNKKVNAAIAKKEHKDDKDNS